jgi:hypothetical protein
MAMTFRLIRAVISFLCLMSPLLGQDVQTRAESMIAKAEQLSDIRAKSSPAFRLSAEFSFADKSLATVKGTYTETWVSESQWRRETIIGELRYVEIGSAADHWVSYSDGFPKKATRLPFLMDVSPPSRAWELVFTSITQNATHDVDAECVFTKPVSDKRIAFCFDKNSGVLLEKIFPETRPRTISDFACEYGRFRSFGDYLFPYEITCFEDGHRSISAKVTELSPLSAAQPSEFSPPADAIELPECSGKSVPPTRFGRDFGFAGLHKTQLAWIPVWLVVDARGKLQTVRVLSTEGKSSYESSLKTLESWSFHSGTCDSKPIAMSLIVEIPYTPR